MNLLYWAIYFFTFGEIITVSFTYQIKLLQLSNGTIYYNESGYLRLIPDYCTRVALGLHNTEVKNIYDLNISFGPPIPIIRYLNFSVRDFKYTLKATMPLRNYSDFYIIGFKKLQFNHRNAAFFSWRKDLITCYKQQYIPGNRIYTSHRIICSLYYSLDVLTRLGYGEIYYKDDGTKFKLARNGTNLINGSCLDCLKDPTTKQWLAGEDARVLINEEVMYLVYNYANLSVWPAFRMMIAKVEMINKTFHVRDKVSTITARHGVNYEHEKNWSPFFHNKMFLLIYSIIPHVILNPWSSSAKSDDLRLRYEGTEGYIADMVAVTVVTDFFWKFGQMRGGTPALLVNNNTYLTFFHSKRRLEGSGRDTYFMGAYTFSSEPPFSILGISPAPIVFPRLYSGKPASTRFDFVVFPTSFSIQGDQIYLYIGLHDRETCLVTLSLQGLLKSLVPVRSVHVGSSSWRQRRDRDFAKVIPDTFRYLK